ncbi:MAG: DUF4145 domain-containing protein [Chitinophagales bacterium]|nr:DUF4145 domain-containing protein [Chitinophagales bacterium]
MKCPHCLNAFYDKLQDYKVVTDIENDWIVRVRICPTCNKSIIHLLGFSMSNGHSQSLLNSEQLIRPKGHNRNPVPKEVPNEFAEDYTEACLILNDSPKASAALSRRCLQGIIRNQLGIKKPNLDQEIQEVITQKLLSSDLLNSIDAVRTIGNFAAHPIKSTSTGEILPVDPHEAEWTLEVLEDIFDYLFVRPALIRNKRALLDLKLKDANKPPLK